mmetsp:Transcript_47911/g.123673  ORF Transcript_47911/g.123673 Transcript_47911/m.123673 type:complete len:212 (+) Transcript_47911:654-1289(+)
MNVPAVTAEAARVLDGERLQLLLKGPEGVGVLAEDDADGERNKRGQRDPHQRSLPRSLQRRPCKFGSVNPQQVQGGEAQRGHDVGTHRQDAMSHRPHADRAVLPAIRLLDLEARRQLEDAPESCEVALVPQHEHVARPRQEVADALDSRILGNCICLVNAGPIEEHVRSRWPEAEHGDGYRQPDDLDTDASGAVAIEEREGDEPRADGRSG